MRPLASIRATVQRRRLARHLHPVPDAGAPERSRRLREALTPATTADPLLAALRETNPSMGREVSDTHWPAARDALLGTSARLRDRSVHGLTGIAPASRTEWPTPGMPPVLVLADDVHVDRLRAVNGKHVLLLTDPLAGRVVATIQVTPDAAASLVSGLMPAAARAPRVVDALIADLHSGTDPVR